jgi:hypothetical protein
MAGACFLNGSEKTQATIGVRQLENAKRKDRGERPPEVAKEAQ